MKNKTQTISKKDLAIIYSKVCDSWKKKIADTLIEQIDSKSIEVSSSVLKEAYSQADISQKSLLEKYFTFESEKKISDQVKTLGDLYKYLDIEEKDVLVFRKPKNDFEKYINACAIIPKITTVYNEVEKLDWTNSSSKYFQYYKMVCQSWACDY